MAAVYNFNGRPALVSSILLKIFKLTSASYYDDRYGFAKLEHAEEERNIVTTLYKWLGIDFATSKLQVGSSITISGITCDLAAGRLGLKPDRRQNLLHHIDDVTSSDRLALADAAKLKGKLGFVSSHFRGRHGRAFLRALSHPQYAGSRDMLLTPTLRASLAVWRSILVAQPGPRTLYDAFGSTPAEVVLFTDGSAPDPRLHEDRSAPVSRIGWVAFVRGSRGVRSQVFFGSYTIPSHVMREWEPRTAQVSMVELFGAVAALTRKRHREP